MPSRRAHMATFPARSHVLEKALRSLVEQVDALHLVLNEYREIPAFLAQLPKVHPVLATEDFKDVGKFVPAPAPDDHVFLVDDDLWYAPGYCDRLEREAREIGLDRHVFGLHANIFGAPAASLSKPSYRLHYRKGLRRSLRVDQLGTGTVLALGKNVAPLDYMRGSQTFVDVRYARWCCENGVSQVALARPFNLVRSLRAGGPTIYRTVTLQDPPQVVAELQAFAGRGAHVGESLGRRLGVVEWLFGA